MKYAVKLSKEFSIENEKVLKLLKLAKVDFEIKDEKRDMVALEFENEILYSANVIGEYLCEKYMQGLKNDDLKKKEWMEWEQHTLYPLLCTNVRENLIDVTNMLQTWESKFVTGFVTGQNKCLSDVLIAVDLDYALDFIDLPVFKTYVGRVLGQKQPRKNLVENREIFKGNTGDSILQIIAGVFTNAVHDAFPELEDFKTSNVARSKNVAHGHFQCNDAMGIFKKLGKNGNLKSPREVGERIKSAVKEVEMIQKLQVAGPGFVNVFLSDHFVISRVHHILKNGVQAMPCDKMKIAVDFSSPNIAKDMHVGHLRSTIIGDAMCRILEFQGHEVVRINHVGDWGTQFGMLICYLMDSFPNWQEEMPNIQDLTSMYKNAKARFDLEPEFVDRARQKVVELQSGDKLALQVWNVLCDISRKEFQKVYDRLDVKLNECGESFYNDMIPMVIQLLKDKGITSMSDGALCVFTTLFKQPFMIQKSDGSYLYDTTDIAALYYRLHTLKADWCIYYTDFSQNDHFKLLFEVGRMANILQPQHRVDHIGFGTVNDEHGQRFKTRSGQSIRLVDLLDEAKTRMKDNLKERVQSGQTSMPESDIEFAAEQLGYGAVKYFDLRQSPVTNYIFHYDRMLATNGDTAVYLLFAYARLASILRKSGMDIVELRNSAKILPKHADEWSLAFELLQFPDIIELIKKDLMSNRLCGYLYTIADKVQSFVTTCRVLGSEEQNSRLLLCIVTMDVMKTCFRLLGIQPLQQI